MSFFLTLSLQTHTVSSPALDLSPAGGKMCKWAQVPLLILSPELCVLILPPQRCLMSWCGWVLDSVPGKQVLLPLFPRRGLALLSLRAGLLPCDLSPVVGCRNAKTGEGCIHDTALLCLEAKTDPPDFLHLWECFYF